MNTIKLKATTFPEILAALFQCVNECPVFDTDSINRVIFEIEVSGAGSISATATNNDATEADLVTESKPTMEDLKGCLSKMAKAGETYIIQFTSGDKKQTLQFERK